jgi:hypothetical protein
LVLLTPLAAAAGLAQLVLLVMAAQVKQVTAGLE